MKFGTVAHLTLFPIPIVKISKFLKYKMAVAAILKHHK